MFSETTYTFGPPGNVAEPPTSGPQVRACTLWSVCESVLPGCQPHAGSQERSCPRGIFSPSLLLSQAGAGRQGEQERGDEASQNGPLTLNGDSPSPHWVPRARAKTPHLLLSQPPPAHHFAPWTRKSPFEEGTQLSPARVSSRERVGRIDWPLLQRNGRLFQAL